MKHFQKGSSFTAGKEGPLMNAEVLTICGSLETLKYQSGRSELCINLRYETLTFTCTWKI